MTIKELIVIVAANHQAANGERVASFFDAKDEAENARWEDSAAEYRYDNGVEIVNCHCEVGESPKGGWFVRYGDEGNMDILTLGEAIRLDDPTDADKYPHEPAIFHSRSQAEEYASKWAVADSAEEEEEEEEEDEA